MLACKMTIYKICKIHYRTLQVVHNEFTDSYDAPRSINNNISIHQKYLRYLAAEVYKTVIEINPKFIRTCEFMKNLILYDLFLFPARSAKDGINKTLNEFRFRLKIGGNILYV